MASFWIVLGMAVLLILGGLYGLFVSAKDGLNIKTLDHNRDDGA